MASGQKAAKKHQLDIANQQNATTVAAQNKQMEATPVQKAIDERSLRILNNTGDWKDSKDVNWSSGQVAKLKDERAQANRGAYTMGAQYADPNLLAGMGAQEEARAAEMEALSSEAAIADAQNSARGDALASGGLTAQRYGSVMDSAGANQRNASDNYIRIAQQPNPWVTGLLGAAKIGAGMFSPIKTPWS